MIKLLNTYIEDTLDFLTKVLFPFADAIDDHVNKKD